MLKGYARLMLFEETDKIAHRFSKDCNITYPEAVPVLWNFQRSSPGDVLGTAFIKRDEKGLTCDVKLPNAPLLLADEKLGIGGFYCGIKTHDENGVTVIDKAILRAVSITLSPAHDEYRLFLYDDAAPIEVLEEEKNDERKNNR